jgi:hypothetical protein
MHGRAIQQARLFKLACIINLVEDAMRRTLDATQIRYPRSGKLVQRMAAIPSFYRVQNKFAAVLRAYDSGHAADLSAALAWQQSANDPQSINPWSAVT